MNKERLNRIEVLSRKNRGAKLQKTVVENIAKKLQVSADSLNFLTVEETDDIRRKNRYEFTFAEEAVKKKANGVYVFTEKKEEVEEFISNLLRKSQDRKVILLTEESEITGAVIVPLKDLLTHYDKMIKLDGDDLIAVTTDGCFGLMIEHFTDRSLTGLKQVYRLGTWEDDKLLQK